MTEHILRQLNLLILHLLLPNEVLANAKLAVDQLQAQAVLDVLNMRVVLELIRDLIDDFLQLEDVLFGDVL